jgi:RNA polymerase sigma-70 factor (ECF subfamily)
MTADPIDDRLDPAPEAADRALSVSIESMLRRWSGIVLGAARRYGLVGDDVEEVRQDIRIRLWRALQRQDGKSGRIAASYMQEAALSATIDLLRRRRRERRLVSLEHMPEDRLSDRSPANELLGEQLERAVASLAPDRGIAVRLHLAGHDRAEIARLTGWSEARARHLLYRGLNDLRERVVEGGLG